MEYVLNLTNEHRSKYIEDGFFILENVIPDKELQLLRDECDALVAEQNTEMDRLKTDTLNLSHRNSRYFVFLAYKNRPQLGEFIFSDLNAQICRATIGNNAFLFWEQFVVKGTDKSKGEFTWHQDSGYVDGPHKPYVNCWIPLDDVHEDNGTIFILPYALAGTKDKIEHKIKEGSKDRVGYFGSEPGTPVVCKAGSIAVFSSTAFHRSGPNLTDKMRRAYAIQFSPEPVYELNGELKGLADAFLKNGSRVR